MSMIPKYDNWTVVVVGGWNPQIVQQQWLSSNIFPNITDIDGEQFQSELLFGPGESLMRVQSQNLVISPMRDRLIVGVKNDADEFLNASSSIMTQVVSILEHTPVQALGVNFAFTIRNDDAPNQLMEAFNINDRAEIGTQGFEISRSSITRELIRDDLIINFKLILNGDHIVVDFNYHFNVNSAEQVAEKLSDGIITYKTQAIDLCRELYGLEIEQTEDE